MKALVFDIRTNSLFSIRIPFTWQSALTYPVLPPSAIIGMIANSLQRYKNNKHPIEYLKLVEKNIFWAGSRLLTPCIIKNYITSAIVKWEDTLGGKFTNALGRQYAYSKKMQIAVLFNDDELIIDINKALQNTPLTCGDNESLISLEDKDIKEPNVNDNVKDKTIETEFPVPFTKDTIFVEPYGNGIVYLMHTRCMKRGSDFPLTSYMIPIREDQTILQPSSLTLEVSNEKVFEIDGIGRIVV